MTMRPFTDHQGGLNHLVDAQIGRAFPVVHKVYQHLDAIEYVAQVYEGGRSRDIVIRTNHTKEWIEWQYKGEAKWTILFKFSDLLGANIADVVAAEQAIAAELVQLRQQLTVSMEDVNEARDAANASYAGAETARAAAEASQTAAAQSAATASTLALNLGVAIADAQASAASAANSRLAAEAAQTDAAASQNAAQEAATGAIAAKNAAALSEAAAVQAAQAAAQSETSTGNFADDAAASASAAALSATTAANHAGVVESAKTATEAAAAEGAQHLAAIRSQVATAEQLRTQTEAASQVGLSAQAAAETAATTAGTHAENAEAAATAAEQSASSADTHRVSAQTYASSASTSAAVATTKAEETTTAATTAVAAATQANSASIAAVGSASTASTQAAEAALSAASANASVSTVIALVDEATAAANSAAVSASTATAKATEATTAASTAITKADEAASSASSALASASSAAASYDSFDDRYLGTKSSDPVTDNDGQPLLEGALYWNTVGKNLRVWNGTGWYVAQFTDAPNDGRAYIRQAGTWVENFSGVGSAVSAETLATARAINGTPFNGSADITTSQWGRARNVTIGATTKSVDGSVNVGWTLSEIGAEPALTAGTAGQYYRGDKTWQPLNSAAVGLGNVDNTSDANKPISTAVASALATKVDVVAGKQLSAEDFSSEEKTKLAGIAAGANAYVHPASHSPSIIAQDASNRFVTDAEKTSWNAKAAGTHVHSKVDVGLDNVDNTSDATKAVLSAAKLTTARTIGGVSFDGSANINLPGVNAAGNQNTTGNAATATKLATARTINGVSFDGTANITVADSSKLPLTGGDVNGNINFTGTARRITGDFSNATASNRLLLQTSAVNGNTTVGAAPNGSGGAAGFAVYAKSDVTNSELLTAYATATSSVVAATKTGSGNFTPLLLLAGDLERLRIDPTTGNVLAISGALGYGEGAGGTVTQATSKSTNVTLNKPSGRIMMHNAALAAGAVAVFQLNNSFIGANDLVVVQPAGGGAGNEYQAWVSYRITGACLINVRNNSAGSRSDAISIQFNVFPGATS